MPKDDVIRLRHMRDAAIEARSFVSGKIRADLDRDRMLALSLVKCVYIMSLGTQETRFMTSVGVRELKGQLSRYLERVKRGERLAITERGKLIAVLSPPLRAAPRSTWSSCFARGSLPGMVASPREPCGPGRSRDARWPTR